MAKFRCFDEPGPPHLPLAQDPAFDKIKMELRDLFPDAALIRSSRRRGTGPGSS